MASELAIQVRGLKKKYGKVTALDDVNVDIAYGTSFGLIGSNGAGKTSFVKALLGIVRPSAGSIKILGSTPGDVASRRRIGYLPERLQLPPAETPRSFLRSVARLKGIVRSRRAAEIEQLLDLVRLEDAARGRRLGKLSKGMRQRCGMAAALCGSPDLLLLDEPSDGVDPIGRAQMREVLHAASQRGVTLFLNSHLLSETEKLCDYVAIVHRGRVVLQGPRSTLQAQNSYQVRFAPQTDLDVTAAHCGFDVDTAARQRGELGRFVFAGEDQTELALALRRALEAGLLLIELQPKLKELERVLEDALSGGMTS